MTVAPPLSSEPTAAAWRPLLEGSDADRAWDAILDIAADLESVPRTTDLAPTLSSGAAGQALFFAYLALATDDEHWLDVACGLLERMVDGAPRVATWPSLYTGFAGLAWTLEHLRGRILDDAPVDPGLERALLEILERGPWQREYDLITGLVGFGVYGLEMLPRPAGAACLARVLEHLEASAERHAEGVVWHTPPDLLPDHQVAVFPKGYYNLGLAHGVPAVLALLGAQCAAGVETERARALLEPAVDWLLAHEGTTGRACFAHALADGAERRPSRLAWCYGDPGVAVALLHAGRLADVPAWREAAYRIALSCAARPEAQAGIVDAGLCHGSLGLALAFRRIAHAAERPLPALDRAARHWLGHALALRRPGTGLGGFAVYKVLEDSGPAWVDSPSFLEGSAGIGLGLLAAVSDVEPAWDRVLMLSMREPGATVAM